MVVMVLSESYIWELSGASDSANGAVQPIKQALSDDFEGKQHREIHRYNILGLYLWGNSSTHWNTSFLPETVT